MPVTGSKIGWLRRRVRTSMPYIGANLVAVGIGALVNAFDPLFLRALIDRALFRHSIHEAVIFTSAIVLCYLVRIGANASSTLASGYVTRTAGVSLKSFAFERVLDFDADRQQQYSVGDRIMMVEDDTMAIATVFADLAPNLFRGVVLLVVNVAVVFYLSPFVGWTLIPVGGLFLWIHLLFRGVLTASSIDVRDKQRIAKELVTESIQGSMHIQFLNAEPDVFAHSVDAWTAMVACQQKQRSKEVKLAAAANGTLLCFVGGVLIYNVWRVMAGHASVGTLVALFAYSTRVLDPITTCADLYARWIQAHASIARLHALSSDEDPQRWTKPRPIALTADHVVAYQKIRLRRDHSFNLDVTSLEFKGGKIHAIAGPSGCGKSTLVSLLIGAVKQDEGNITINEVPLESYSLRDLRELIAFVPQSPVLFSGTVRTNLCLGRCDLQDKRLMEALRTVGLLRGWEEDESVLNRLVSERGANLSGGERQRLSIARALLREPQILVLDEATSALDAQGERMLFAELEKLAVSVLIVLITHRVDAIPRDANLVLMEAGMIRTRGPHSSIRESSKLYQELRIASLSQLTIL